MCHLSFTINKEVKINDYCTRRSVSRKSAYRLIRESEIVTRRYQVVVRTLVSDLIRITRFEDAYMINRNKPQLQREVKRFREEGITGLRLRSKRTHNSPWSMYNYRRRQFN